MVVVDVTVVGVYGVVTYVVDVDEGVVEDDELYPVLAGE